VKGSRGSAMEKVVDALRRLAEAPAASTGGAPGTEKTPAPGADSAAARSR